MTTREARRPGKGAPSRSPRGSSEAFSEVLSGRWGDVCAEPTLNVGPFHAHLLRALPGAPGALAEARPREGSPWATATGRRGEASCAQEQRGPALCPAISWPLLSSSFLTFLRLVFPWYQEENVHFLAVAP